MGWKLNKEQIHTLEDNMEIDEWIETVDTLNEEAEFNELEESRLVEAF